MKKVNFKKSVLALVAFTVAASFISCASTKSSGSASYKIKDGDGVVGYFMFEEGDIEDNEVKDYSSNGLYVENASMDDPVFVDGKNGSALYFNGQDEYLTLDPSIVDGDGLTIAAWIKPDGPWSIWARFFDIGDTTKDVFVAHDGRMPGTVVFYEQSTKASCNAPLPAAGKWVHIAATLGNGKIALYVNGALVKEQPCDVTTADLAGESNLGCWIGRSNWPDALFRGSIDDLLIATRKFSKNEIKAVFNGIVPPEA